MDSESNNFFRKRYTPEQRAADLRPYIDPGMVNHRRVQSFVGPAGMRVIDRLTNELPATINEWQRTVRIDHIYTTVALEMCRQLDAQPLGVVAADPAPRVGTVVCSTELLEGSLEVYEKARMTLRWRPTIGYERQVFLELSTKHITADTLRSRLAKTHVVSFIAVLDEVQEDRLVLAPLIMGGQWLQAPPEGVTFDTMWIHWAFYEHFLEDIGEFERVGAVPEKVDWSPMKDISETAFKFCLCEILGDSPAKDWSGERSDHFTSHVHLRGRRLTAAFLLKGPGNGFSRMEMTHLGKNGDQIFRLASEPAEMLVVQHCHEIGSAVRATLRAFAVQPHQARRYCLIDSQDSFRLLTAYGMVEKALKLSGRG